MSWPKLVNGQVVSVDTDGTSNGTVGDPYSLTFTVEQFVGDASLTPTVYADAGTQVPPGLAVTAIGPRLTISGTPAAAGTYRILISSTNRCLTLTSAPVVDIVIADRLTITTAFLPDGVAGVAYSQTLQATAGTTPYTWSVDPNLAPLPSWLTLDANGLLHGTPPAPATINFTAVVTDASTTPVSASKALTLTIDATAAVPPSITVPPSDQTVTVGSAATFAVQATGTSPLTYQWQKNGTNIGTDFATLVTAPTTAADNGALFHVIVSNGAGSVTSTDARLTVNSPTTLAITTTSLPAGTGAVSTPYNASIQATGGVTPYTWSAVGLPPGLTASTNIDNSGTLSGSSSRGGMFPVVVTVADSSGNHASKAFTLAMPCVYHKTPGQPANENVNLVGKFAFRFSGFDASGHAVARVGLIDLNGNDSAQLNNGLGGVAGEEDVAAGAAGGTSFRHEAFVASSSYCLSNGRFGTTGTLTLNTATSSVSYSIASSGTSANIIEFDPVDDIHGAGVLKVQTATALSAPANYVFGFSGRDHRNGPASVAGVFNVNAALAGTTGEDDFNDPVINTVGLTTLNNSIVAGFAAAPDASGRTTGTISATGNATATGEIDFVAYVVDSDVGGNATELFALNNGSGALPATELPVLSGGIYRQNISQPATGAALTSYALFYLNGVDPTDATFERTAATVGIVDFNATAISAIEFDAEVGGTTFGPSTATAGSAYTLGADGRMAITPPTGVSLPPIIAYLSDVSTGVLLDTSPGAGLGRMFKHLFDLQNRLTFGPIGNFGPAAERSTLGVGGIGIGIGASTLVLGQDLDSPSAGGLIFNSQSAELGYTALDNLNGRFTAGICTAPRNPTDVCIVGYGQYGSVTTTIGDVVIDETSGTTGTKPNVMFWGGVP